MGQGQEQTIHGKIETNSPQIHKKMLILRETNLIYNSIQKKKTTPQGINLNKEVKLQNIDENYKILMEKKLKERK